MATSLSVGPRRCRALAAVSTEYLQGPAGDSTTDLDEEIEMPSTHGFVVGTSVLGGENDLLTMQYSEDDKKLAQVETRPHGAGEIWDVAAHPRRKLLISCWASASEQRGLSLTSDDASVSSIEGGEGARCVAFANPKSGGDSFGSIHEDGVIKVWVFREGEDAPVVESALPSNTRFRGTKDLAWDPNHPGVLITALGGPFASVVDVRERQAVATIETGTRCLTVDANPNRPHFFLTSGEDQIIKFWDARKASEPVQILRDGHQHWVTRARFNPFHDQLVVSSSTDGSVCLWRATSVSSAPLLDLESDEEDDAKLENRKQHQDGLVKIYDENMDSVYGLAWSAVNAWIFASLSYDGKLAIHGVPSGEKYKILL